MAIVRRYTAQVVYVTTEEDAAVLRAISGARDISDAAVMRELWARFADELAREAGVPVESTDDGWRLETAGARTV